MDLELTNQSKNKVEEELISKQSEVQQFKFLEIQLNKKVSEFEYELLAKEKALASSEKLLEVMLQKKINTMWNWTQYLESFWTYSCNVFKPIVQRRRSALKF